MKSAPIFRWLAAAGFILAWLMSSHTLAQPSKVLPADPAEFIKVIGEEVGKFGTKEESDFMKDFTDHWNTARYLDTEKERVIQQSNIMRLKNYSVYPDVFRFIQLFESVKNEASFARLDLEEVFVSVDSMVQAYPERKQTNSYISNLIIFVKEGKVAKTRISAWSFTQNNPRIVFTSAYSDELKKTFHFPKLIFSGTDIKYSSEKDSTIVMGTAGELNFLNRIWKADGGKITWEKMHLDPVNVYCELQDYMVNLNYSFIKIDTVTFYYRGLIDKPLKGGFEDLNKGYGDINKANYPFFRSYEGGVVIENFIPKVRYEGGFSLRGIRKIGSAYYELVDIPDEPVPSTPDTPDEEDPDADLYNEWEEEFGPYDESAFIIDEGSMIDDTTVWDEPEAGTDASEESEADIFGPDFDEEMMGKELKLFKAKLTILHNSKPVVVLKAIEFVMDLNKLVSSKTEVTVYMGEDSIVHPSLKTVYTVETDEVVMMKEVKDCESRQPFISPYHNFNLYFDAVRYKLGADTVRFTSIIDKKHEIGAIESVDFFRKDRFDQFKSVLPFNPIGAIHRYMNLKPGVKIYPTDILSDKEYKLSEKEWYDAFIFALRDLECSGFVKMEPDGEIVPQPKLTEWALAARGRKDFDAIQILSQVESGTNADMKISTMEMVMKGVAFFSLSDSNFVRAKPNGRKVTILKNRDMKWGGRVAAGKIDFDSDSLEAFRFEYNNYKVLVDSVDLHFVLERDPPLGFTFSPLQKALRGTTIEGVTGAVYINKTSNKSGRDTLYEYSIFDSYTNSYVYWDKDSIHGGVYDRKKLYFSIDPFVLDSLERFNERGLQFEGEFYSNEIFPRFRQVLTVMEDQTLGMKQITPDTGYKTYNGKGLYHGEIALDGEGLHGKGQMEFLGTTAKSENFEMFFDSVKAVTNDFFMPGGERNGAYFPEIKASQVEYKWHTKQDVIELVSDEKNPIVLFGGEGTFVGKLIITPVGLQGSGSLTMGNVTVESKRFVFKEKDFEAQKGNFIVADKKDPAKVLYKGENVNIQYDVNKHHSSFTAEETGVANSSFPQQEYRSSLGTGTYDKTTNDLVLESRSVKLFDNYFYSTAESQDSLNFYASKAHYNFDDQKIEIEGVPFIYVADAKLLPDSNNVTVGNDGLLRTLKNAVIECDTSTNYHRLYKADIKVDGRVNYSGKGKYDYIKIDDKEQFINMTEIGVRPDTTTVAKGVIDSTQKFFITNRIQFRGNVELTASQKNMHFKGEVQIVSSNPVFKGNWLPFDKVVSPDSVYIDITQDMVAGRKLAVGLHFKPMYRAFYSTFLQPKPEIKDVDLMSASGVLTFDRTKEEFRIGPQNKFQQKQFRGVISSFNDETNVITTQGLIEMPTKFAKEIEFQMAGSWRDELSTKTVTTNLAIRAKLDAIPPEAWAKLAERAVLVTGGNAFVEFHDRLLQESIAEFLDPREDEKAAKQFAEQVEKSVVTSDIKVAKAASDYKPASLLLTNVPMKYSPDFRSLYAIGEVGIIGINGAAINRLSNSNTRIEYNIGKTAPNGVRLNDTLHIYIEFAEFEWVYLRVLNDEIKVASSDVGGFIAELTKALEKRKKDDGYRFNLITESDKESFIGRFRDRYILFEGGGGGGDPIPDIPPSPDDLPQEPDGGGMDDGLDDPVPGDSLDGGGGGGSGGGGDDPSGGGDPSGSGDPPGGGGDPPAGDDPSGGSGEPPKGGDDGGKGGKKKGGKKGSGDPPPPPSGEEPPAGGDEPPADGGGG